MSIKTNYLRFDGMPNNWLLKHWTNKINNSKDTFQGRLEPSLLFPDERAADYQIRFLPSHIMKKMNPYEVFRERADHTTKH